MVKLKPSPTERIAGLAFFLFTIIQVPYFVAETQLSSTGLVLLSPLQMTTANLARTFPACEPAMEWVLIPGACTNPAFKQAFRVPWCPDATKGWMRESLSPYIMCKFKSGGRPCELQQSRLFDLDYVRKGNNLPLLVKLLESEGLEQQLPILYGSTMIVVASLFSLVYSVKTAVLGFVLLGYGVVQGNHIPLPPGVLTAFLCVYAGFNLGELRGNLRDQQRQRQSGDSSSQQPGATVKKLDASGSPASKKPPAGSQKAQSKKQRKHA